MFVFFLFSLPVVTVFIASVIQEHSIWGPRRSSWTATACRPSSWRGQHWETWAESRKPSSILEKPCVWRPAGSTVTKVCLCLKPQDHVHRKALTQSLMFQVWSTVTWPPMAFGRQWGWQTTSIRLWGPTLRPWPSWPQCVWKTQSLRRKPKLCWTKPWPRDPTTPKLWSKKQNCSVCRWKTS